MIYILDARSRVTLDIQGPPGKDLLNLKKNMNMNIIFIFLNFRTTWSTW